MTTSTSIYAPRARLAILTRPVRQLRALTSTELRNLRDHGVACSANWMVSPSGDGETGTLFKPVRGEGGLFNARIFAMQA